jgi:hypothetical protein
MVRARLPMQLLPRTRRPHDLRCRRIGDLPLGRSGLAAALPLRLALSGFSAVPRCGVYLGAVLTTTQGQYATLNVNAMQCAEAAATTVAVSYDGESPEERVLRRARRWTPLSATV